MARILVVDDERDIAALIAFLLQKDGHAVIQAHDGKQAMRELGFSANGGRERPSADFDLIVLDVMMPIMDGYSVSAKLSEDPATREIPIIILTAKGELKDIFAPSSNVAAYLQKPFNPQKLRETVGEILSARK